MNGIPYPFGVGTFPNAVRFYGMARGFSGVLVAILLAFSLFLSPRQLVATAAGGTATGLLAGGIGPQLFIDLRDEMLLRGFSHQTGRRNLIPILLGLGPAFAGVIVAIFEIFLGNFPALSAPFFFWALAHLFGATAVHSQHIFRELNGLATQTSKPISMTYGVTGPLFRFEPSRLDLAAPKNEDGSSAVKKRA